MDNSPADSNVFDDSTHVCAHVPLDSLVSNQTRLIVQWIFLTFLGPIMAVFGIMTNVINIICFTKQGFRESVNISLLCLSISDLGSLLTLLWTNICYIPSLNDLDLPFEPIQIQYLTGGWPHSTFTHVTSWITAFITLERCLCVTMPLKVKTLLAPKKVTSVIVLMYISLIAAASPLYFITSLQLKLSPTRNKTILDLVYKDGSEQVEAVIYSVNNVLIPFSAFILVIVCTSYLIAVLRTKTKWRNVYLTSDQWQTMSSREKKVTRMMAMISTLFIVCFFPVCIVVIAMIATPELSVGGKYQNILFILASVSFLLESINSTLNIFIYYHMSSKYKEIFRHFIICRKN